MRCSLGSNHLAVITILTQAIPSYYADADVQTNPGETTMMLWYQSTLNLVQHHNYKESLASHFRKVASPGTEVVLNGRHGGLGSELAASDVLGSPVVYHSVVNLVFIQSLLDAEKTGADAFIAASFSEPILAELRSLASIPVISMPEACFAAAFTSAPKVGLVTLNRHVIPYLEKSISLHKWQDRVSGIHLIEGDISETELNAKFAEPEPYLKRLTLGIQEAIKAGAQVVIPAEGVLGAMAAENGLSQVDGIPVVDAIGTPILFAEFVVALKNRTDVAQSLAAYPPPSDAARLIISESVTRA
jgi:allantoin racemase